MDGDFMNGSVGLPRGSMLRIDEGAGVLLHVWEGEVWLTHEGSCRDHVLQTGQEFRLQRGGVSLAHAFRRSVVSLSAAASGQAARRVSLLPAGGEVRVVLYAGGAPRARGALRRLRDLLLPSRPAAAARTS